MTYGRPGNRVAQIENAIAWLSVEISRSSESRRRQLIEERERPRAELAQAESGVIRQSREHGKNQDPWRWVRHR